ncbi:Hypothetical protein SRAE_0000050100 [Strongyloides ratti]|uniref:Uncharacterized protein n=1 Tax=Strongyloides ratti TaxID=34506 RepID=A0A090KV26_STRRB|nr:Hypothetical protein SRAE_0000050100 [Strongyloides ratti]CEF61375.1 Hypothetical protein SRAE_0000050100 [Strongyloides ratti]
MCVKLSSTPHPNLHDIILICNFDWKLGLFGSSSPDPFRFLSGFPVGLPEIPYENNEAPVLAFFASLAGEVFFLFLPPELVTERDLDLDQAVLAELSCEVVDVV